MMGSDTHGDLTHTYISTNTHNEYTQHGVDAVCDLCTGDFSIFLGANVRVCVVWVCMCVYVYLGGVCVCLCVCVCSNCPMSVSTQVCAHRACTAVEHARVSCL